MLRKQRRHTNINRADGFVVGVGGGHGHDVEPQAFDGDAQDEGHTRRVVGVVAFPNEPLANLFQFAAAGLVIGGAFFLVDRLLCASPQKACKRCSPSCTTKESLSASAPG